MRSITSCNRVTCVFSFALFAFVGASHATGQTAPTSATGSLHGTVLHAVTRAPLAAAVVVLEETGQQALTGDDGRFVLERVAPGAYHLLTAAPGFIPSRAEVTVTAARGDPIEVPLAPELHYTEVISVSPNARDQFEAYQATSVLAGQELAIALENSLGAALATQPGIAQRSFGPGPSRPVIRGLDGDRVLILEDGQRTGDLSSQSGDHGVAVNPAAASRLEVVRGPATLLYGANAIGGLVNVISESVPARPVTGVGGGAQLDLGTAAEEVGGAADVVVGSGRWALRAGGSANRSGDVQTPEGEIANSQSRGAFADVGGAWTTEQGFLGASYAYDDTRYGLPYVEEGQVELTPRRHVVNLRGEARQLSGWFDSARGSVGYRRYRHEEIVAGEVGTRFKNDSVEFDVLGSHRRFGRLDGTIGAWGLVRAFSSTGEESLSPPVDQSGFASFAYEELTWSHATLQFGGRYERAAFTPEGGLPNREFNNFSGSVGVMLRPSDATTLALSVARAVRNPALEELYFFGPHPGNFAFEIGNPDLESEKGLGVDASFRWRLPRVHGEVAFFRNDIRDYVFRDPISEEEFDLRYGGEDIAGDPEDEEHDHGGLPIIEFAAADSVLQGLEAHADVQITSRLLAEVGADYVRGELKESNQPLPRIPPFRFRAGLRYQWNALQAGGEVITVGEQDRVFADETPTDGYALLKLFASYSFQAGGAVNTVTARLDNATNELYRNHLSYVKDFVPEMGRNFKVVYNIKF